MEYSLSQIEKGPLDCCSHDARYSLSEDRLLREADEFIPDIRNRLEQKLMEQRLDEAGAAMSLIEEEAIEHRLEMIRLRTVRSVKV